MRLGYMAPAPLLEPAELADMAVLAEDLGYDSVFVTDQFQPWRQVGHAAAVVPWLSYVGARTTSIGLGVGGFSAAMRRSPAVVAQDFATLGCLLPGRVTLCLGTGAGHDEIAATGHKWPTAQRRIGRLREAVTIVRRLWQGERITYRGEFYKTDDAQLYDLPAVPVPLLVSASSTGETLVAAELADGILTTSDRGTQQQADVVLPTVRDALTPPRRAFDLTLEVKISYDHNPKQATKSSRLWMPAEVMDPADPTMFEATRAAIPDLVATEWLVGSRPEDVLPVLLRYAELGFDHLIFSSPSNNQERFLRDFAADLLPELRGPHVSAAAG